MLTATPVTKSTLRLLAGILTGLPLLAAGTLPALPVRFEPNLGQSHSDVLFLTRENASQAWFTRSEAVFALPGERREPVAVRLQWLGAASAVTVTGEEALGGRSNYLLGRDRAQWRTGVPHYARIRYRNLYPGTDLVFYTRDRQIEYDFVLAPQADPGRIRFRFAGTAVRTTPEGDLVVPAGERRMVQKRPVAYQTIDGQRRPVEAEYALAADGIGLRLGSYDRTRELVIDPVITFSTFLGGGKGERGTGIGVDAAGNIYVAGATASTNFPMAAPYQNTLKSGRDVFVTKLNNSGTAILYSTYIGGSFNINGFGDDFATDLAVDAAGNAYVAGGTNSADFPTTPGSYDTTYGGVFGDAFALKLNPTGSALLYSTYLGGGETDTAWGIAIDGAGAAHVAGYTESLNFPVTGAYQGTNRGGGGDGFVVKLNAAGSGLVYSTYLGGTSEDRAFGIAVDGAGVAYVTGETQSGNFPVAAAYQAVKGDARDAFLTRLSASGGLLSSTFLGGTGSDIGFAVAVDSAGNGYVAGETASNNFPRQGGVQAAFGGFSDAFVTKFTPAANQLVYSTYLGGGLTDGAFALAVDSQGQAHITGRTWSENFPLADAFQTRYGGAFSDGFVAKLNTAGSALVYSSYLGGANEDNWDNNAGFLGVGGVAIDGSGGAYYTGRTDSSNFPTTAGVVQPQFGGRSFTVGDDNVGDAFVLKIGGAGGGGTTPPPVSGLRFQPMTPCRVADTRNAPGQFGGPVMAAGATRSFAIPQSNCAIPTSALAYSLNVTVVPRGPLGYLSVWPGGQPQPLVSTLNSPLGNIVANAAIVPAGTGGAINVFVTNQADLILDINGYFDVPNSDNFTFYPANPCRVADTRNAAGVFGGPAIPGLQTRSFPVPDSACGIPASARAYSMNATVVPPGPMQYLSLWPSGAPQPLVSTLNAFEGQIVANAALVPAGTAGGVSAFVSNASDVILDINGYFGPATPSGLSFYPVTPCRVADTRNAAGVFGGPVMAASGTRSFPVPQSSCGIPATARAYSINVTVVPDAGTLHYLSAWPAGSAQPLVSTLNSFNGSIAANAAIVPAGTAGAINLFATHRTHVIVDINGYFAP